MKNYSIKQSSSDPLLNRFQLQWDEESDLKERARILRRMTAYVKKRYGTGTEFAEALISKVEILEAEVISLFDFASSVIADVRRYTKASGKNYGSALAKMPTGEDLDRVKELKGPKGVASADSLAEIDPELVGEEEVDTMRYAGN